MGHYKNQVTAAIPQESWSGPVTLANYSDRARAHFAARVKQGHQTEPYADINEKFGVLVEWEAYFRIHLGGYPFVFEMVLNKRAKAFGVPETRPEIFDPSWSPHGQSVAAVRRLLEIGVHKPLYAKAIPGPPLGEDYNSLFAKYGRPQGRFEKDPR